MNLSRSTLQRPVTVVMVFVCLAVVGFISARLLPLEYFPELDAPFVAVNIPYPNSTPEEIEREITRPVEEVLATISGIKRMVADSSDSESNLFIEFEWGTETDIKTIEAKEKIESIRNQLPRDVERINIQKFNTSDMALLTVRLSSSRDLSESYDMLNRVFKRRLERIKGVSRVVLYGVDKKQIMIRLLADRIEAHSIDLNRLADTLRNSHFQLAAGRISDSGKRFTVRPLGELHSIEDVRGLIVNAQGVRLRDIAEVNLEKPDLLYGRHLNRSYAVGVDIFKEAGANIVDIGEKVKREIEAVRADPKMADIQIYLMEDAADSVRSSLNELAKSGMFGALLAVLVLFLFMRQWASTLLVALAVPFSLLVTLACMFFLGISLNILSMLGLLLAVGMLVDNSVVVTENIYRHQRAGEEKRQASIIGVKEVGLAIAAGTTTTAIVFLPNVISANNQVSVWLKYTAIPFIIALFASLLLAQTIVPLLTSRLKRLPEASKTRWVDRLVERYQRLLRWLLSHRRVALALVLGSLLSVAIPIALVKKDMFPPQEDRRLRLFYNLNDVYTKEKVEASVYRVEDYLFSKQKEFEIESVYTYFQGDQADTTILLLKGDKAHKRQEQIQNEILAGLPEVAIGTLTFERIRSGGSTNELRVQLVGRSTDQLVPLSRDLARFLGLIPGFKNVRSEAALGKKEVHVTVDRERAKRLGVSPQDAAGNIAVAMRGVNLRRMYDEEGEIDVRVEFHKRDKRNLEQLQNIKLFRSGQEPVTLGALADFSFRQGPNAIHREDRVTAIGVSLDLDGLTVPQAKDKIAAVMGNFVLPTGVSWNYGRTFDFEQEATQTMLINTLLAMALIFFIMAAIFECIFYPLAIWSSILFAIVGVWWFFLISGTTFSLMAWIGVLILIGVVVNNGIVLIYRINQLREQGLSRDEAILQGGAHRIRPILMTAGTTIFSLVPLCLTTIQIGGDGPPYYPMARAIVGGLAFSTLVTLVILPEIYLLLDDFRNWYWRLVRSAWK